MDLTPRELYVKNLFFPKILDEPEAQILTKRISSIGERLGFVGDQGSDSRRKHKYDVWIAIQIKKEMAMDPVPSPSIIDRETELFSILDWAIENSPDLMALNFEQALAQQKRWISRLAKQGVIRQIPIDQDRVIYRCSNGHFLYLLKPEDLPFEGAAMHNCVGGGNFKNKLKNGRSLIISLRDEKNQPHATIEVDINKEKSGKLTGTVIQQLGKGNKPVVEKYHSSLREFVLFSNGALSKDDAEFLSEV